jgi:hypothetical protein
MRPARTFVLLLAAFLGAAGQPVAVISLVSPAEAPGGVSPAELPPGLAPFGLSCSECSLAADAACSVLWISPVVADARGARIKSANRQCYKVPREGGAGPTETCDVLESVTFAELHYFRPPPPAIPDRFRVLHSTGDVHADEAGIVLSPDRRYVVFATPSDGALTVTAACPVDESRELK